MTLFLTIYHADNGRPLPEGFQMELGEGALAKQDYRLDRSDAAEVDARLTLLGLAMESLGWEVSFTHEAPSGSARPAHGFHLIE